MGWRDINMNRRRPPPRYATVVVEPGGDRAIAVMHKASMAAIDAVATQLEEAASGGEGAFTDFVAGYLLGFARLKALKDAVDCEAQMGGMADLAREQARVVPAAWGIDLGRIGFAPRPANAKSRTGLQLTLGNGHLTADAGYLVGHLESLSGSRALLARALARMRQGGGAGPAYLTDCDVAADPMQTREPTLSLRFEGAERAVITGAIDQLSS